MASKKLGRGLATIVPLAPAGDDGRLRIEETLFERADSESVLTLSGRSVEDFFRVAHAAEARLGTAPAAVATAVLPPPMETPPAPAATAVAEVVVREEVRAAPVAPAPSAPPPPEPVVEATAFVDDVLFSDDVLVGAEIAVEQQAEAPAPPPPAPAPPPAAAAPAAPEPAFKDDLVFVDDAIGGIVLPEVEME